MAATLMNQHHNALPPPPRQIRFIHNQGHPPSKRRRINAACLTCRRRKTRCAGERPLCSTCTKNGHCCLGYPEDTKKDHHSGDSRNGRSVSRDHHSSTKASDDDTSKAAKKLKTVPVGAASPTDLALTPGSTSSQRPTDAVRPSQQQQHSPLVHDANSPHARFSDDIAPESPDIRRNHDHDHRVPYFRYFGPTAIVPGYKQMVVSVRDRRRSTTGSHNAMSPISDPNGIMSSNAAESDIVIEEPPSYDPSDPAPVHPLIISLAKTFFTNLGCNYPFLEQRKFMRMIKEKQAEAMLVDAVCALAARFSDSPILTGGNDKMPRTARGHVFAQRARQATVDTFPCPSVSAVQACLLMAYEGFGANQDSALWMYLGLAIRMAVDLGLQKVIGTQYQGDQDPWNTRQRRTTADSESPMEIRDQLDTPSHAEQKELEQERIDTFWAVFVLDRVISSGTGRPVTLRDEDFELSIPRTTLDPNTTWPTPFPTLLEIIHLYGRVCDVLNNIHDVSDLGQDKWQRLSEIEGHLTKIYKTWDSRLQFNVNNFKAYLGIGQGTTFILLHFWFHALFIVLHQPTLMTPFGDLRGELQLLSDSRELSMSSARTICDILAFADLIDPNSFIGNPFTSQPIYIAACAFLMESSAKASAAPSREATPPLPPKQGKGSRHSLLASAANQHYNRCYSSLQAMHAYWGGIKYILTALDQKAKGIWDVETYTSEEYEMTRQGQLDLGDQFGFNNPLSPKNGGPPIGWTLAGTTNSPNSSFTLMYSNFNGGMTPGNTTHQHMHRADSTPPAAIYDSTRSSHGAMYPPSFHQATTSQVRANPRPVMNLSGHGQPIMEDENGNKIFLPPNFTPSSQHSNSFEAYSASPASTLGDGTGRSSHNMYYQQDMPYQTQWGLSSGNMDAITFDSQEIDIGALGLQQPELMGPWLDSIPGDVLGLFDHQDHMANEQGGR